MILPTPHRNAPLLRACTTGFVMMAIILPFFILSAEQALSQPDTGYRDFNFGTTVNANPTGEKPESKLWWNDGLWWGSLWDPSAGTYTIHRFSVATQSWTSTGTAIDGRSNAKGDALWDGQKLYVVSHVFSNSPGPVSSASAGKLWRYSYNATSKVYTLDSGFPVDVNASRSETLVLAKDGTGQLWVTWQEAGKVKVNRTTGSDNTWGTPFDLPVQGNNTDADDISTVLAFGGDKVGILWSNQDDLKMYFAVHLDANGDTSWEPREEALSDANLGGVADDHINLKLSCDDGGTLYAATKTSLSGVNAPLIFVLTRSLAGSWSRQIFGTGGDDHTRPILLVDSDNRMLYCFATSPTSSSSGRMSIYMKSTSLDNITFSFGLGTPFISSSQDLEVNDATSTKQCVNGTTGLLVLASDEGSRFYLHNYMALGGGGGNQTPTAVNDAAETDQNTAVAIDVTANDFDSDGTIDKTTVAIASPASNGSTSVHPTTGVVTYTPDSGFFGSDAFTYTVKDNEGATSNAATVSISVNAAGGATVTFNPTNDAHVKSTSPTSNYGSVTTLRVRSGEYNSYLKFNVAGLGGTVISARLRLFVTDDGPDGGSVYSVSNNYQSTSTPWLEGGLNWNNAPAISGSPLSSAGSAVLNTWEELDVTAAITGNGTFSFGITNSSTNSVLYSSKEGANDPQLVVETSSGGTPPPVVSSFNPTSGPVGTQVTINGSNFTGATNVAFNGTSASFNFISDAQLQATVPSGATTGPISVTTSAGPGSSATNFTVTTLPSPPVVSSFNPTSGPVGTQVTINGSNFTGTTNVAFNGTSASFSFISDAQLQATVPSGATTGPISVTTSAGPGSSATNFTVTTLPSPPVVSSFNPTSGPVGTQVTITGSNFTGATNVAFNGTSASFTVNSSTQITTTVPSGATTGPISVTTSAGTGASATNFTVTTPPSPPVVSSFSPTSGPVGTQVTINGSNFTGATNVAFNGTSASFTVNLSTQITTTVPSGATTGPISVTTSAGTGASATNFTVTTPPPPPVVSSFNPTSGPVGTQVTISGSNFTGATNVAFNGTSASFTVNSSTQITATVPSGATTGPISVTTSAGTGASATNFTVTTGGGGTLTFNPTDDAQVKSTSPTSNYGSVTTLRLRSGEYNSYLKFNVTGVGTVISARIRLFVTDDGPDGGSIYSVSNNYQSTSTPWVEGGLNWNNAPAISGSPLSSAGSAALNTWEELDVTAAITGNGVFSFGVTNGSTNSVLYSSKEGANDPQLIVETSSGGTPAPSISSFNPTNGPVGTQVTVNGSNFTGATNVAFNGTSASFSFISDAQLQATVPSGATTGIIGVTTSGGTGFSSNAFTVTVPPSAPVVSSFNPTSGPVGTQVTINGSNFTGTTSVTFNGTSASFSFVSDAELQATVPSGATTGPISVTNGVGPGSSASNFTVTTGGGGTLTFNPAEDAYVRNTTPTGTTGSETAVRVRSGSTTVYSYFKFNLTGVTGPVSSAVLRLFVTNDGPNGGTIYSTSNNYLGNSTPWVEEGLTWNNAPSTSGAALSSAGSAALNNWVELNVTSAITGDGTFSFTLRGGSTDVVFYSSKEGSNDPQLVVTWGASAIESEPEVSLRKGSSASHGLELPKEFSLSPAFPNPFNAQTKIEYALATAAQVKLEIYNIAGQRVRVLVDEFQSEGFKSVVWDGKDDDRRAVGSGVYLVRMIAEQNGFVRRMTMIK